MCGGCGRPLSTPSPGDRPLRKGGGLVDAPDSGLVGAKVEFPFHPIFPSPDFGFRFVLLGERIHAVHLEVEDPVTTSYSAGGSGKVGLNAKVAATS